MLFSLALWVICSVTVVKVGLYSSVGSPLAEARDFTQVENATLLVSRGRRSDLRMDYTRIYFEIYSSKGYSVCTSVQDVGWLHLTHQKPCKQMFEEVLQKLEASKQKWPPPKEIPLVLKDEFTLGGRVQVSEQYFDHEKHHRNPEAHHWSSHTIQSYIEKAHKRESFSYGAVETSFIYNVLKQYPIKQQSGIVLGTETPWLEGILLASGAQKATTVEYHEIKSEHPQIETLTPEKLVQSWLSNASTLYDFAISFSSYEHDGLGRYGDPIDPWGDVWDVTRVGCLVKPQGLFFLGVPMGPDQIVWNAHRIYGPLRLPLLTANWEILGVWDESGWIDNYEELWNLAVRLHKQPVIVMRNTRTQSCH